MKNSENTYKNLDFFEHFENYENYIFGKKEKAAFRYADRKKSKKNLKNPEISRIPGPDIRGSRGRRSGEAGLPGYRSR